MTDEQIDRENLEAEVVDAIRNLHDEHLSILRAITLDLLRVQNGPEPNDSDDG